MNTPHNAITGKYSLEVRSIIIPGYDKRKDMQVKVNPQKPYEGTQICMYSILFNR